MENITTLLNDCLKQFSETEEYRMMQGYRTRDNRFTFDERLAIAKSVERTFAPIFELMKADVPTIKDSDLLFCALSIQHFETIAIAECLTVTPEAVRMRRFRIREKLPSKWIDILFPEMKRNSNADVTSQTLAEPNAEITLPSQITKNVKVMKEKMSFGNAVAICFSKYFTLKGRARRSEYWYFYLFSSIVGIFVMILKSIIETSVGAIGGVAAVQLSHIIVESFYWIINIALFIPGFTVFVRRLHDIDDNGWLAVLLYIVPSIIVRVESFIMASGGFEIKPNMQPKEAMDVLAAFVPILFSLIICLGAIIAGIIICCKPGTNGPNTYGPDPIRYISKVENQE